MRAVSGQQDLQGKGPQGQGPKEGSTITKMEGREVPGRMRAVVQRSFGGPEVLQLSEVDRPAPDHSQVLVRVHAAGVNPIDCAARAGQLSTETPATLPRTIGRDVSGVVEQVADDQTGFRPGDQVYGLLDDCEGGYAEFVAAPARYLARKPQGLSHVQAAGLPLAGLTAWQMLTETARVHAGQRVLIHAAAGGVGHLAVQTAKALGAHVLGTARADKHDLLRSLGVDEPIDYTTTNFTQAAHQVDVVVNLVGGPYIRRSAAVLGRGGLLLTVRSAGYEADLAEAARRGVRTARFLVRPDAAGLERLTELVEAGALRVVIDTVLPLDRAAEAHTRMETGHTTGKIVLTTTT
jgi:NADPH:quinone reductase-like Zn-dependent oxidoreductase